MPMDSLLFPLENDLEMLEVYLKTLLCEIFSYKESPVIYCMLIHHLNHALFRKNSKLKNRILSDAKEDSCSVQFKKLLRSVEMSQNALLKNHLKNYSCFNPNTEFGLELD